MQDINAAALVKSYLKDHGVKQSYIAENLGITPTEVSYKLNGKLKLTADDLIKIAMILKTSPNSLSNFDELIAQGSM